MDVKNNTMTFPNGRPQGITRPFLVLAPSETYAFAPSAAINFDLRQEKNCSVSFSAVLLI